MLGAVQPLADARSVQTTLVVPAGALVRGDAGAIEQVLVNLLSNAIRFNRVGGRVAVEVAGSFEEATPLMIHVHDDGEGLLPDQLAQLFQPFNRLGAERRRISGTGLGLVIARSLARAMGGELAVDSAPGQGARFTFTLPLRK